MTHRISAQQLGFSIPSPRGFDWSEPPDLYEVGPWAVLCTRGAYRLVYNVRHNRWFAEHEAHTDHEGSGLDPEGALLDLAAKVPALGPEVAKMIKEANQ